MHNSRLNIKVTTSIDWASPAEDDDEDILRTRAAVNIQAAAEKLKPAFTQMLITYVDELMSERAAAREP